MNKIRREIIKRGSQFGGAHFGPALSLVEIMWAINEVATDEDRIILSKGHGYLAHEVIAEEFYRDPGPRCLSLGMGLSFGIGLALAKPSRVFVVLGDGECNEGAVWEAAMSAVHFKLTNLIVVVDYNGMQSDGMTSKVLDCSLSDMFEGFGWDVEFLGGHNLAALTRALELLDHSGPACLIADTIKGKGVSFMEDSPDWHYGKLTEAQYAAAMKELA